MRDRDRSPTFNRRDVVFGTAGALAAAAASFPTGLAQTTSPADAAAYFDETGRVPGSPQPSAPLVEHYDVTGWVHPFAVGEFECLAVSDGSSLNTDPNDPFNFFDLVFGTSPPEDIQAALDAGGYNRGNVIRQDTFVLVQTGNEAVLIDTGFGAALGGALMSNLEGAGIEPGDIDVVITTHGHPDHIGGNVDESGAPTFPNARYVMAEEEWNFWADTALVERAYPNAAISEGVLAFVNAQMLPLADRYDLIGFDEEIVPGMISIATPGHTPGHMSVLVQSNGESLWIGGDFAGHPVGMRNPSFAGVADAVPEQVEATRRRMFQRLAQGGLAHFGHFDPFPGLGHVSADGNAWLWEPIADDE